MSLSGTGWAKWRAGLRCVLFAHAAMYVANAPMLAFADEIMRQVTPTNDSKPERYSVDISKNLQVIPVNIGKHLVGKIAKVEVSLKNTLDSDLDLVLRPACNCTGLSLSKMSAAKSESIVVIADVKMPGSAQKFTSAIQFTDQKREISFVMVVEADVIDVVAIEPSQIVIDQSNRPFSTTICIRPTDPNVKVIKMESESDRFRIVDDKEIEPSNYSVLIQPSEAEDTLEESFSIRIVYELTEASSESPGKDSKSEASAVPITKGFFVPVRYADRVSMGPRVSTWKLIDGRYRAKLYLQGLSPEKNLDQGKLTLSNGKLRIPVETDKLFKRTEKAVVFEASFDPNELPNLAEDKSWIIEFESLKFRASSRVVLEASN